MKLKLYLQNSSDGTIYDVSDISEEIEVSQSVDGDAGKLKCVLQKDPNNLLKIANGSIISFLVNGKGFFFGYVFKIGTDADANYEITAYDQLRYLKNSDVIVTKNMTASNIFRMVCKKYNLKYKIKVPTKYKPEAYVHDNKTLYNVIKRGMDLASINDKKQYYIADRFGRINWSEYGVEKTNIILGDGSMTTSYTYEKTIDDDTYNQIKLYREDKDKGKRDVWIVKDSNNIKRWGILQYLKKADNDANASQIKQTAKNLLKVKNSETETLKIEGEGITELVAGRGLKFVLKREGINKWMWIKSSTHTFTKYSHTMDLEVEI